MSKAKDAILELALKRYKHASEYWQKQRKREKDDLRFQIPELQWDEDAKRARLGDAVAGVPVPPRPILSISKLDQPIQLVLNQERAAHLGVNVHPLSPDANDDTAEVIQGLYRQIERDSQAGTARSWAFDRAVKAGRGAYRILTRYDDAGGHPFDKVITIERLLYQDAVTFDPSAQKPDFSDGEFAFVTEWVPLERFKALYPKASVSKAERLEFDEIVRETPEWIKSDGETKAVLVAEYFYKEYEDAVYVALKDGRAVAEDELTEEDEIDPDIPKRTKQECVVQWCKLTAGEVLDAEEWDGHLIPLVPAIGRELQPFDAERHWVGLIGPAKDSQRGYNYAVSNAIEIAALEPKAPFIAAEGSFEGHADEWQQANTRNFPYLEYKPIVFQGQPMPAPARMPIDASRLTISMELAQQFNDGIQSTTQAFDPSLGKLPTKDRSGKAIQALQGQSDEGNSHYLHNMADISMSLEARIVLDLIPAIYDRPGRIVRTLDDEDESEMVMINAPHVIHPETGQPIKHNPALPLPPAGPQPGAPPAEVKHYDLRKGVYGVSVSIGKSWQSRLEQGSEEIGQILQAQPNLMPIIGPLYFKFRDFPGARELADLLKKVREKQFPGLDDDESGQLSPEAAQAQLQAAKQQVQQLQQQLQQAAMELKTEQAKQQATVQKAQMDNASRERIATEKNTITLLVEKMDNQSKLLDSILMRMHEGDMKKADMAHDLGMLGAGQIHQVHAQALTPPAAPAGGEPPFTGADSEPLGSDQGV